MENTSTHVEEFCDVVVIGAGHAGCEAALAAARLGLDTVMFTVSVDSIALMPCNPNIGGTSKGHLVCELDALGGEMGKCIDRTFIQSKMLNQSKGPAVHSLRAQADKQAYTREMRKTAENTPHLRIKQAEIASLLAETITKTENVCEKAPSTDKKEQQDTASLAQFAMEKKQENDVSIHPEQSLNIREEDACGERQHQQAAYRITGVVTTSGAVYHAKAVVLCTGVYLNARCIYGDVSEYTGPNGLRAATHLTDAMLQLGIKMRRFKTGTPARVDGRSIDYSQLEEQKGDENLRPFSFSNNPEDIEREQVSCWLAYTNDETHALIRSNISRSPLFSGDIKGTGPRYCPSIEDKVIKFPDKERHQIFVEPEGLYTNEMYLSGMSSSLPEDVQHAMIRTMKGFSHAEIVRNAYAIEYDCIDANQLRPTLGFKALEGLYAGGQINGSSGYEEAAVQGFVAGVNAALWIMGKEPLIIDRSEGYIGVLIDDLVTKESHEPYRMMTSRAEYRLLLRQDNADLRLREKGYQIGLITQAQYDRLCEKKAQIEAEVKRMKELTAGANDTVNAFLSLHHSAELMDGHGATFEQLIKRPELSYEALLPLDPDRPSLSWRVREQVNIEIKYEGYIHRQMQQVAQFRKMEGKKLPRSLNYQDINGLRLEAQQKLNQMHPENIGQASRISGVSPADISVLLIYLEQQRRLKQA